LPLLSPTKELATLVGQYARPTIKFIAYPLPFLPTLTWNEMQDTGTRLRLVVIHQNLAPKSTFSTITPTIIYNKKPQNF
jgi:hypothetical protein